MTVHRMGFGAMRITGRGVWGLPPDPAAALRLLGHVVEAGVNFIDTADSYGPDVSEDLIAEALAPYPDGLVIATKAGNLRPGPSSWVADCRPEHLRAACEGSLKRLRLERIDLYQLHRVDPNVPFEDQVGALADLQKEGKIRHVGLSNVSLAQLDTARKIVAIASVQNRYNVADRESDGIVDACSASSIAFIPYFPIDAGDLAEKSGKLGHVADAHGATAAQVALAWLLHRSPVILPIPGTSSVAHFDENVAATKLTLSDAEFAELAA
jgi:aryl-alcohol dehydrogenase-like predicted oxidoreductase